MTLLIAGLALFIGIHLLPTFEPLRDSLADKLGANAYRGVFSLLALAGLVLIVIGKGRAGFEPVYQPPSWGRLAPAILMLPALILLPAANMPTNIKRYTRHPMLWGVVLWAGAHLMANGDKASLLLFGSLGVYAVFDMISANLRGAQKSTTRYPIKKDLMVVAAGVIAYGVLVAAHPWLFGVAVH